MDREERGDTGTGGGRERGGKGWGGELTVQSS